MVKLTPRKWIENRSVKLVAEAPKQKDIQGDEIYIHYLLVEGRAACHHIYLNQEEYYLKSEDVIAGIYDMPWVEEKQEHEFPGLNDGEKEYLGDMSIRDKG